VSVATSRLFLTGIRAQGHHGANPGEQDVAQDFVVDLDVEVEVSGDDIGSTADYRVLIRTARATVERERFALLESVAESVARAVAAEEGVVRATAIVHKPAAARSNDVQGVAAAATAGRDA
jgi:dihydroneopterin aldolase